MAWRPIPQQPDVRSVENVATVKISECMVTRNLLKANKVTEVAWATLTHNALQEFTVALVLNTTRFCTVYAVPPTSPIDQRLRWLGLDSRPLHVKNCSFRLHTHTLFCSHRNMPASFQKLNHSSSPIKSMYLCIISD